MLASSVRVLAITGAICVAGILAAGQTVCGRVQDPNGGPISGALIQISSGSPGKASSGTGTTTGADGRFCAPDVPAGTILQIQAPHFGVATVSVSSTTTNLTITLRVTPVEQEISVSARGSVAQTQTAETVDLLSSSDLVSGGALMLDEKLRNLAGFSLFRRSSSRSANPSSQGASLRGIGATAATRVMVISDGVPLADPFGGWVYWDRIPEAGVDSVEVLRGGGSHLYGSGAMGGVVDIIPVRNFRGVSLDASLGTSLNSGASLLAGIGWGRWDLSASAEGFRTNGYIPVAPPNRGAIDSPATERYGSGNVRLRRHVGERWTALLGGDVLDEGRHNGTLLQMNDTRFLSLLAGADYVGGSSTFALRAYGQAQRFSQTFSAIGAERDSETLTRWDRVPSQREGASANWFRAAGRHLFTLGGDFTTVLGAGHGVIFAGPATRQDAAGGRQRITGVYGRDAIRFGQRTVLSAGVRFDHWTNYRGFQTSGGITDVLASKISSALSPDLSLLINAAGGVSLHAGAYGAFRAPALQELYRGFRVGNIVTLANESLGPEHLRGVEAGAGYTQARLSTRATAFWNRIADPIISRTLSSTPDLITRQRDNLGRTGTFGVEASTQLQIARLQFRAAYQYANARVLVSPANPALIGKFVPQVPHHSFTAGGVTTWRAWSAAVQFRAMGVQFDDDVNLFPLHAFAVTDLRIGRRIADTTEVYVAAENIFNTHYEVGRTPTPTVAQGASVRLGVRLRVSR